MAVNLDIDVETLKCEIKKTYAQVSAEPETEFIFPTGRAWALYLGYPPGPARARRRRRKRHRRRHDARDDRQGTRELHQARRPECRVHRKRGRTAPVRRRKLRRRDLQIAGALLEAEYASLLKQHRFERIETGDLVDTYARSTFEDTRRKAEKFGARGTTVKAYKPPT